MYIYGKNVAEEYLNSDKKIKRAFIQKNLNDKDIYNKIAKKVEKVNIVSKQDIDNIVKGNHQGIVLEVEEYKYASIDDILNLEDALVLILDHIEDPHNLGAVIRTAEAAGVDAIIIPNDRSACVNATVIKVSVGTTENVNIIRVTNLVNVIKTLKDNGYWIFGTDMNGEDYTKLNYKGKCAIVCGNEGSGMSRLVRENCDFIASIPMKGKVNSLNASVATAIVVFEALKQRG